METLVKLSQDQLDTCLKEIPYGKNTFPGKSPNFPSPSFLLQPSFHCKCYICSAEIFIISPFKPPLWGSQAEQGNQAMGALKREAISFAAWNILAETHWACMGRD